MPKSAAPGGLLPPAARDARRDRRLFRRTHPIRLRIPAPPHANPPATPHGPGGPCAASTPPCWALDSNQVARSSRAGRRGARSTTGSVGGSIETVYYSRLARSNIEEGAAAAPALPSPKLMRKIYMTERSAATAEPQGGRRRAARGAAAARRPHEEAV